MKDSKDSKVGPGGPASTTRIRTGAAEGHNIRLWRLHRGYKTHAELAEAARKADPAGIGLARNVIGRLENGYYRYNQDHIELLARTLRCEARDLIGLDPGGDIFRLYDGLPERHKKEAEEIIAIFTALSDREKRTATNLMRKLKTTRSR